MTYTCRLDSIRDLEEQLLVFGGILSPHEHLYRESAAFDLIKVFRCKDVSGTDRRYGGKAQTFFLRGQDVERIEGEKHQCRGKFVAEKPELVVY
jgi:hypothetical protein